MKRAGWIVVFSIIMFAFIGQGFCTVKTELQFQLQEKAFLNSEGIKTISEMLSDVSFEEKMMLYSTYKRDDAYNGFYLNCVLPGLGIGNYVIGDTQGGTITLVGTLVSWAVFLGSYGLAYTTFSRPIVIGMAIAGGGGVLFFLFRGVISPFTYVDNYNNQLKKALLMGNMVFDDVFHADLISISF
jgi:hypothetical protein